MGGQLIKGYAIQGQALGQTGVNKLWKLYKAKKDKDSVQASIFLIQKRQLKKQEKQQYIKLAKRQASGLVRVRHPGVLAVVQPLTEDQNILAFVSERVEGSIAHLLKQNRLNQFIGSELELKLYLYPFIDTIAFLHDSLKQVHLAISLQNIYIAADGKWKLAGFVNNTALTAQQMSTDEKPQQYSTCAPELALKGKFSKKSDVFSIGVVLVRLIESIYKQNKGFTINDKIQYEKKSGQLQKLSMSAVIQKSKHPSQLQKLLEEMLNWEELGRCNLSSILSSRWMNEGSLVTVKYLDKISNYQNKQQLQFLKGLAGIIQDYQSRVLTRIILPKLLDLLKFGHLVASVLYILLDLLKKGKLINDVFQRSVWPSLKNVAQGKQLTAQAIYLFVMNQQILQKQVGEGDTLNYLLPLYLKCFDCPLKLKILALSSLQKLSKRIDYQVMKTRIIPKLVAILRDPAIQTRQAALKGLYSIIRIIDAQTITSTILPAIDSARKAGSDPFINCIITHIYNILGNELPIDTLSSKILPVLLPSLTDISLTKTQFYQTKSAIITMIARIQKQREKSFDSNAQINEISYSEKDFVFKAEQPKPGETTKGNYNFLSMYIQQNKPAQPEVIRPTIPQNSTFNTTITYNMNNVSNTNDMNFSLYNTSKQMQVKNKLPNITIPTINSNLENNNQFTLNFDSLAFNTKSQSVKPSLVNLKTQEFDLFKPSPQIPKISQTKPIIKTQQPKITVPIMPNNLQPLGKNTKIIQSPKKPQIQIKSTQPKKFVMGASGPMQIKKFTGPPTQKGIKKPPIEPQQDIQYFMNPVQKQTTPNSFNLDFGGISNISSIKTQPIAINNSMYKKQKIQDNPFADIQDQIVINNNTKQTSDIYSYFQQNKSKNQKQSKPFDLI